MRLSIDLAGNYLKLKITSLSCIIWCRFQRHADTVARVAADLATDGRGNRPCVAGRRMTGRRAGDLSRAARA